MSDPYVPTLTHPSQVSAKPAKVTKIIADGVAEQITFTQRFAKKFLFTGTKGTNVVNGADVFIGSDSSTEVIKVTPGATVTIESDRDGMPLDLSRFWIRGTATDGVVVDFTEGLI